MDGDASFPTTSKHGPGNWAGRRHGPPPGQRLTLRVLDLRPVRAACMPTPSERAPLGPASAATNRHLGSRPGGERTAAVNPGSLERGVGADGQVERRVSRNGSLGSSRRRGDSEPPAGRPHRGHFSRRRPRIVLNNSRARRVLEPTARSSVGASRSGFPLVLRRGASHDRRRAIAGWNSRSDVGPSTAYVGPSRQPAPSGANLERPHFVGSSAMRIPLESGAPSRVASTSCVEGAR